MSGTDSEWHDLMDAWQSEAPDEAAPPPLSEEIRRRIQRKVRRHGIGLILLAVTEVVMCVGLVVWLLQEVLERRRPVDFVGFGGVLLLCVVALGFSFWNRRGTWWPAAESTRTFIDLSIERSRRKLLTLRYCPGFLAAEVAFLAAWGGWVLLDRPQPVAPARWIGYYGFLALFTAAVFGWVIWYRKRTLRELAEFEELRRSLGDEESGSSMPSSDSGTSEAAEAPPLNPRSRS